MMKIEKWFDLMRCLKIFIIIHNINKMNSIIGIINLESTVTILLDIHSSSNTINIIRLTCDNLYTNTMISLCFQRKKQA